MSLFPVMNWILDQPVIMVIEVEITCAESFYDCFPTGVCMHIWFGTCDLGITSHPWTVISCISDFFASVPQQCSLCFQRTLSACNVLFSVNILN